MLADVDLRGLDRAPAPALALVLALVLSRIQVLEMEGGRRSSIQVPQHSPPSPPHWVQVRRSIQVPEEKESKESENSIYLPYFL